MEPVTPSQTPRETSPGEPDEDNDPTDLHVRIDTAELSLTSLPRVDDEQLTAGTMLGEYRVEGLLGKGGMGFVYAAVHPLIGKRAAVKVLRRELCREPLAVARFIDEARVVNQIGHPNIVDVFAFGQTTDGRSYFVMEWLKGESLGARVARSRLELDEIRSIVKSLASALSAAHDQGVIHRDLKPDNVFLVDVPGHGTGVKLLDFGVAKLVSAPHRIEQTASNAIIGTPQYISPEQAKSHLVDHRADTYAFGAILFELLTGRPPFFADNAMEVVAMHLMEPAPRPSMFAPVPPEIDALVVAMLAKSPDERPALVEVAARFERTSWLERTRVHGAVGEPSPDADPAAAAATAGHSAARRRASRRVLLAAGLVVALAIAFFLVRRIAEPDGGDRKAGIVNPPPPADGSGGPAAIAPVAAGSQGGAPAAATGAPPAESTDPSTAARGRMPDRAAPGPRAGSSGSSARVELSRTRPPVPPPPAAAPTPSTRTLRLVVDATDFVAKIDGKRVGPSTELLPGRYRLRVCARGKRLYEHEIEIASRDVGWRVELEPLRDQDLQCRD